MSEDSEKEDYSDRTISDEDESDEDMFMKFVSEDLHRCALLTDWTPSCPEPVYIPTGLETEPLYPDSKEATVVYLAEDAYKEPCFVYSRVGGNQTPSKQPVDYRDNTLMFEARFESGNLQKVVKVAEYEYQLTVRPDLFTNKHTQWYYFQVTNMRAGIVYRFTIVNFTKPASLYSRGMRPLFYSEKEAKAHHIGWQRIGDQIKYYRNNPGQDGHHYFSLTWTFQFPHNKDTCYFAHCYPYTYTNLQEYLSGISNDPVRSKFCKIRVLCHTLARNMVYILTITTPLKNSDSRKRKAVILTARVHPGETNSSWIMKGFLDYILGNSSDAQLLRDTFVFKVVPMLNPDGVIVGNYRCSLAGRDLNRNYTSLLKESFPSVWYTRNMVHRLMEKREVILYCDLHGHSRKENIFMYGCDGSDRSKTLYLQQRIFPLMLSKNCPDKFSFSACKFNVQKSKEGTGRVVMWKMGIRNSFTMEATFCGSTLGNKRGTHFSTKDLESMGYHFCDSLLDYCDPDRTKYYRCLKELEEMERHITLEKVFEDSDTPVIDITLDVESSSRGSDSSESIDSLTYLLKLTSQKKHLKTKKERNSTIASHQNAREAQEVYDRGHLLQRHKQSNSDVKDTRPNEPDDYMVDYFRRQLPNQGLDLHHNLKSKIKECISFQSKKTGINWTDDEKRSYKDKGIVQTQEILQYLLPIMHSTKNMQTTQMKQLFNPRTNFQIQHQLNPATCRNVKKYSTSWTAPRNHPFVIQGDVMANSSEWVQSKPHGSLESLSPLKGPKKNKHSQIWAIKNEDIKPLSSKWEPASSSFGMDANVLKYKSLQAEETNQQSSKHTALHLTKNKDEQASKNDGQPTLYLKFQRES
ncbi:cytosolic carboxypeptidase 3 isoform X2 [Gorilla gorilla gorilla]|uniref:cytosolic carboxypeptidase 3 isoform X2 n=1 Tax=Gorilla gorilla gorilla TaxID=9595 RepID=UPI0024464D87|nr:cytosolic carboxypeptidase 3 isoform X2 [Gorilla gorilla gorilla]